MQQVFSPKQVARAIGASESSVKRWCDRGILPSVKTGGGHRRVPLAGVLEFVRAKSCALASPAELGLPAKVGVARESIASALPQFNSALAQGDYPACRRLLLDLYLAKHSIAKICDEVIAPAMNSLGDGWCDGSIGIHEERRGCELTLRLIFEMRAMISSASPAAPVAMGASIEKDPYSLPTRMVELSLLEAGWNAVSLGCGVPLSSLKNAVVECPPRLLWLSVSALEDTEEFVDQYADLFSVCDKVAVVIGGRGLGEDVRAKMQYSAHCENLQRLKTFAKALHPATG